MKLLLVEDEPLLSAAVAKGLRKRGYAVDCAYDGEEALALYAVNEYDLMLLGDFFKPAKCRMARDFFARQGVFPQPS